MTGRVTPNTLFSLMAGLFLLLQAVPGALAAIPVEQKLAADRWTWCELYWFDHDHIADSVTQYLERMDPLYEHASGQHGVIVNLAWVVDYIAEWQGDLDQRITLLPLDVLRTWNRLSLNLQRRPPPFDRVVYAPWTYRDLKRLAEEFRRQAAERYGMKDFKFATTLLGYEDFYNTPMPNWRTEHSEAYFHDERFKVNVGRLNPGAPLKPDLRRYAAFPEGIPGGTPFYRFFARQWGSLSKVVGIDGLMFEDDMFGPPEYSSYGPWGERGSWDPAEMERWHQAAASLVRETKQANPACLVIGYSSAVGGVAEWRVGGVDLERIAREGYLDGWVDQTWGGAWNEYWNQHHLGYTFQLAFLLTHAAQLAGTKTRHYITVEGGDGFEPWDVLHAVPEKLRWEIWAYSHAALKTPKGEKFPAGMVFAVTTRGRDLWSEEDVQFLAKNADAATADTLSIQETRGPTLVYNRPYLEWLQREHPDWLVKEFIDDYAGMVMKWQVPIISITRVEWLPQVRSDLFVVQTPAQLDAQSAGAMLKLIHSGEPLAIVSDPTYGIDPRLNEILSPPCKTVPQVSGEKGIWTSTTVPDRSLKNAWIITKVPRITDGMSPSFALWQGFYSQVGSPQGTVIYKTSACPDLLLSGAGDLHWLFWNPPFFSPAEFKGPSTMDELIASQEPYLLAARSLLRLLSDTGRSPFDSPSPVDLPLAVHYWKTGDGKFEFLVGNLERSLPGDSDTPKMLKLDLPLGWVANGVTQLVFRELTGEGRVTAHQDPGRRWQAEIPVAANGSSVWVLDKE